MLLRWPRQLLLLILTVAFMLPVVAVFASWLPWGESGTAAAQILQEMSATVLPDYIWTTVRLSLMVGLGVMLVGLSVAAAVTLF
ncbi:MAG: iron(III) transport system permease protein, partial [Rhodoferax sp.]